MGHRENLRDNRLSVNPPQQVITISSLERHSGDDPLLPLWKFPTCHHWMTHSCWLQSWSSCSLPLCPSSMTFPSVETSSEFRIIYFRRRGGEMNCVVAPGVHLLLPPHITPRSLHRLPHLAKRPVCRVCVSVPSANSGESSSCYMLAAPTTHDEPSPEPPPSMASKPVIFKSLPTQSHFAPNYYHDHHTHSTAALQMSQFYNSELATATAAAAVALIRGGGYGGGSGWGNPYADNRTATPLEYLNNEHQQQQIVVPPSADNCWGHRNGHPGVSSAEGTQQQATSCRSHGSDVTSPIRRKPRRRVATLAQRRAANIRERRRMFNLNEAFDRLRRKI